MCFTHGHRSHSQWHILTGETVANILDSKVRTKTQYRETPDAVSTSLLWLQNLAEAGP